MGTPAKYRDRPHCFTIRFAPIYTFRTIYAVNARNLLKHRPENLGRITAEVTT